AETVLWSGDRSDCVLKELQFSEERFVVGNHGAAQAVAVAVNVFRRGVDDDVGAKSDGLLQHRRGERVIHHDAYASSTADGGARCDVGDSEQWIGRSLQPEQSGLRTDGLFHRGEIAGIDE